MKEFNALLEDGKTLAISLRQDGFTQRAEVVDRMLLELTGVGSPEDAIKAQLQLANCFWLRSQATGLSHLAALLIRDASRWDALINIRQMKRMGAALRPTEPHEPRFTTSLLMEFNVSQPEASAPEDILHFTEFVDQLAVIRANVLQAAYIQRGKEEMAPR